MPVLLCTEECQSKFVDFKDQLLVIVVDEAVSTCRDVDAGRLRRVHDASHLAFAIFTSGSTGKPKGVLVPHRGVSRMISSGEID